MAYGGSSPILDSIWRIGMLVVLGIVVLVLCGFLGAYSGSTWSRFDDGISESDPLRNLDFELTGKRAAKTK